MLNRYRPLVKSYLEAIVRPLAKIGMTPNMLTIIGLLITLIASYLFALGNQRLAAIFLIFGSFIDALDGSLARLTGRTSGFGAFLDSTTDRISDGAVLFGMAYGGLIDWKVAYIALIGFYLVSYERCRAELSGSGSLAIGIAERAERLIIIILSALVMKVELGVYIAAALAWITALQRLIEAKKRLG